jgi:AcrR family transcriptional regulator
LASTPLAEQLSRSPRPAPAGPLDAFKLARHRFIAGDRVSMGELASELGTSRVTLHRWVGNRDQLLGEILWDLTDRTLSDARAATRRRGGAGVAQALGRFFEVVNQSSFMRSFLEREPEIALRVLTTKRAPVQSRLVETVREMLAAEVDAGRLEPPMNLDDLAYIIVRLGESFVYTDIITGAQPNPARAAQAIAVLLR